MLPVSYPYPGQVRVEKPQDLKIMLGYPSFTGVREVAYERIIAATALYDDEHHALGTTILTRLREQGVELVDAMTLEAMADARLIPVRWRGYGAVHFFAPIFLTEDGRRLVRSIAWNGVVWVHGYSRLGDGFGKDDFVATLLP